MRARDPGSSAGLAVREAGTARLVPARIGRHACTMRKAGLSRARSSPVSLGTLGSLASKPMRPLMDDSLEGLVSKVEALHLAEDDVAIISAPGPISDEVAHRLRET